MINQLNELFGATERPKNTTHYFEKMTPEQSDAFYFLTKKWQDITWKDWSDHPDAIFLFNESEFLYYLPSLLKISIIHKSENELLNATCSFISMLDRSDNFKNWDDFFIARVKMFSFQQIKFIQNWILYMSEFDFFPPDQLDRAFKTLEIILSLDLQKNRAQKQRGQKTK